MQFPSVFINFRSEVIKIGVEKVVNFAVKTLHGWRNAKYLLYSNQNVDAYYYFYD